jgi:hypothetical protein
MNHVSHAPDAVAGDGLSAAIDLDDARRAAACDGRRVGLDIEGASL